MQLATVKIDKPEATNFVLGQTHKEKTQAENREIERLTDKLNATMAALDEKKQALRQMEHALGQVGAELEKTRA